MSRHQRPSLRLAAILSASYLVSPHSGATPPDSRQPESVKSVSPAQRIVEVTATTRKTEFKYLEPIVVRFVAKNVSTQRISVPRSDNPYRDFQLRVFDRAGKLLPRSRFDPGGLSGGGPPGYDPGQVFRGKLVANLLYDMTAAGVYTIIVDVPVLTNIPGRRAVVEHSDPIMVNVIGGMNLDDEDGK